MPSIHLSKSAVKQLLNNADLREARAENTLPALLHFRRAYSTSHDGTVTEHGDGFTLTTIDPEDEKEMEGKVFVNVRVADDLDILVGGSPPIMSGSFTIGWSRWKFTREPQDPQ